MAGKVLMLVLLVAATASAHTQLSQVNGRSDVVRKFVGAGFKGVTWTQNFPPQYPLWDVKSVDVTCGRGAETQAAGSLAVVAGSEITLTFSHNSLRDDIIADSHKGPCIVYLAKKGEEKTAGWFKIYEDAFSNGLWCTDKLIRNKGDLKVTIPKGVGNGNYVVRSEVIALHEAFDEWPTANVDNGPGAQLYVHCADLVISGGDDKAVSPKVAIPGNDWVSSQRTPGILFNIYNSSPSSYPRIGPVIASFGGQSPATTTSTTSTAPATSSAPATTTTAATTTTKPPTTTNPNPVPSVDNCAVSYQTFWSANNMFGGRIYVKATGGSCKNWKVTYSPSSPVNIYDLWNAQRTSVNNNVHVFEPRFWNANIADGNYAEFGFNAAGDGSAPLSISVNGQVVNVDRITQSALDDSSVLKNDATLGQLFANQTDMKLLGNGVFNGVGAVGASVMVTLFATLVAVFLV
eukprot:Colp12_sorted_trinity150504_noHs@24392